TVIAPTGEPVFLSHGDAESIESAIHRYRAHLDGSDADAAPETLRKAEATLHARLLAPLEEHLAPGQTVIFSPDAQLHFIPLGLLRNAEGKAFAEKYPVRYVSSGRDLVKEVPQRKSTGLKAFALGNPTYRDNSPMLALAKAEEDANKNILTSNLRAGMGQSSGSIQFRPLPGTAREVGSLSTLLEGSGYEVATLSGK
ncbi:MAG TPA: CHAT domain-containing protein, partial [Bacteroidia bacterium]|nr:CHAT domain-containing protein [Bacteroidia bacterium]